jgi:hypothetical protein
VRKVGEDDDDDWETDPEPANPISEKEQRRGAATLPSDRKDFGSVHDLREQVIEQDHAALTVDTHGITAARTAEYQNPGHDATTH